MQYLYTTTHLQEVKMSVTIKNNSNIKKNHLFAAAFTLLYL